MKYVVYLDGGKLVDGFTQEGKTLPTADQVSKEGYKLDGWYDDATFTTPHSGDIESGTPVYAKWLPYVAKIGDAKYTSLQEAINAVPSDGTETTIEMIHNTNEAVDIPDGKSSEYKNIVLDLHGYVIDAKDKKNSVIINGNYNKLTLKDTDTQDSTKEATTVHYFTVDENGLWKYVGETAPDGDYKTVTGGVITGGTGGKTYISGGGVYNSNCTLTMNGGNIVGNTSNNGGGVINFGSSSFTMNSGNIVGNTALYGGGVMNTGSGSLTMNGGNIVGNRSDNGGGVVNYSDSFTVGGTAVIKDNNNKDGTNTNNVYIANGKTSTTITISTTTPLAEGAFIGVTTETAPTSGNPVAITSNGTEDDLQYFHADKSGEAVVFNTDHFDLVIGYNYTVYKGVASTGTYDTGLAAVTTWYLDGGGSGVAKASFFAENYPTATSLFIKDTVTDGTYWSSTSNPTYKITVKSPTVKTDPTIVTGELTYDGTEQKLLSSGGAASDALDGVTPVMQYAFDKDFTTVITDVNDVKGKEADTYTVYYRAAIDTATPLITSESGNVSKDIDCVSLTVSGTTVENKVYDGTTDATVSVPGTLEGVVSGDDVVIDKASGTFDNKNVGDGIDVTVSYTLSGKDAGNYEVEDYSTTADITPATITNVSVTQSQEMRYNGSMQTPTVTTTATTVDGSDVTFAYSLTQENYGSMPQVGPAIGETTVYYQATAENHDNATGSFTASIIPSTYAVTFNDDGATWITTKPTEYTYGEGLVLPTSPADFVKVGYTFGGWYDNAGFTGTPVTAISTTDTGGKEYWAKWTLNTYTVTFNANGGEGSMDKQAIESGVATKLNKNTFKRTGYTFDGWATSEEGDVEYADEEEVTLTEDLDLYAHWTVIKPKPSGGSQNTGSGNYSEYPRTADGNGGVVSFGTSKNVKAVELPAGVKGEVILKTKTSEKGPEGAETLLVFEINIRNYPEGTPAGITYEFPLSEIEMAGNTPADYILMHKDSDTEWSKLPTTYEVTGTKVVYTAVTTAFSPFAVVYAEGGAKPVDEVIAVVEQTAVVTAAPTAAPTAEPVKTAAPTAVPTKAASSPLALGGVLAGLAAAAVLGLGRRE